MKTMLDNKIFEKITVYDFQALCLEKTLKKGEEVLVKRDVEQICEKKIDLYALRQKNLEFSERIRGLK